jgi:type IV pilus assembly protein PilA
MLADIRERNRSEGGFTLIELLVVMIIIAILMAVAVPTFLAQKNNAQKSKATSNIKQIVNTVEACAVNNTDGTYTGCTTTANLQAVEKGLKNLTLADGTSPALNGYSVDPVGTQGYIVQAQIQDGDAKVYFAEIHKETGDLLKICGGSAFSGSSTAGSTVAGSRTCTNGKWG